MIGKLDDWQVVKRQTRDRGAVWAFIARLIFVLPDAEGVTPSRVTWTVRNIQTGEVRTITAASEKEFSERLAAQAFD